MKLVITFVIAVIGAVACSNELCPCPSGFATLTLPPSVAGMVPRTTADTCTPLDSSPPGEYLMFSATKDTTCHVRLDFPNGAVLTATLAFHGLGGCCPDTYSGSVVTTSFDGGTGD